MSFLSRWMLTIALALIPLLNVTAEEKTFTDVDYTTDYHNEITSLSGVEGIFKGNDDGTFDPLGKINRAEMATLLMRLVNLPEGNSLKIKMVLPKCERKGYPDVPQGIWYEEGVYKAQCLGLMTGDEKGTFRPNDPLTITEITTVLNRAYASLDLSDGAWYESGLNWAEDKMLIPSTVNGLTHQVSRAEMAHMFYILKEPFLDPLAALNASYLTAKEVVEGRPAVLNLTPTENTVFVLREGDRGKLEIIKKWSTMGQLPAEIFEKNPLPWKFSLDPIETFGIHYMQLVDAENKAIPIYGMDASEETHELYPLFYTDLFNHYLSTPDGVTGLYYPSEWQEYSSYISYALPIWPSGEINQHKEWLTIPYVDGYVGALNLETGAFVLHKLNTKDYSEAVADNEGVVYIESNTWGCVTEDHLLKMGLTLTVENKPCRIIYQTREGQEAILNEIQEPYPVKGLYSYWLRMTKENIFINKTVWGCTNFCPQVSIYDRLNNGGIEAREIWALDPSSTESEPSFRHYTPQKGWITYNTKDIKLEANQWNKWFEDFWKVHPELTNPETLYK